MLELVVTLGLISILAGFAAAHLSTSDLGLFQGRQRLVADLRTTRARALITGDHFRLTVTDDQSYTIHRMQLAGDEWTPITASAETRTLPRGSRFTAGVGSGFEFNTRGLLVTTASAGDLDLVDTRTGFTHRVTVWPSGQVAP